MNLSVKKSRIPDRIYFAFGVLEENFLKNNHHKELIKLQILQHELARDAAQRIN